MLAIGKASNSYMHSQLREEQTAHAEVISELLKPEAADEEARSGEGRADGVDRACSVEICAAGKYSPARP